MVDTLSEVMTEMSDVTGNKEDSEEDSEEQVFLRSLKESLIEVAFSSPMGMVAVCR